LKLSQAGLDACCIGDATFIRLHQLTESNRQATAKQPPSAPGPVFKAKGKGQAEKSKRLS
jgi:hypothetical protein